MDYTQIVLKYIYIYLACDNLGNGLDSPPEVGMPQHRRSARVTCDQLQNPFGAQSNVQVLI